MQALQRADTMGLRPVAGKKCLMPDLHVEMSWQHLHQPCVAGMV